MTDLTENNEELVAIVVDNQDKEDNDILSLLIGASVPFNKAKGLLKKIQEAKGLIFTKEDRDVKAAELLSGFSVSSETTADEVAEQVENLMGELNCKVGIARGYVKAMFDEDEIPMPKATRATAGPRAPKAPGFRGDVKIAADFAIANPTPSDTDLEDFKAYMDDNGGSETKTGTDKSKRWYAAVLDLRIFAAQWKDAGNCS